jgi:hypothetical protein
MACFDFCQIKFRKFGFDEKKLPSLGKIIIFGISNNLRIGKFLEIIP